MTADTTTLTGELIRWTMHGDRGWGRGIVRTSDGRDVTAVGVVVGARQGDGIEAHGVWETHAKFGPQFTVARARLTAPVSLDGVTAWLEAELPNVGAHRAVALVAHFGSVAELWRVIEHEPHRLAEVRGITAARSTEIRQAWLATSEDREHQIQLREWGLTSTQIHHCLQAWGSAERTVAAVGTNPYELHRKVTGFGWLRADVVAIQTRVPRDSPMRITSGLEYVLEQNLERGHVWMAPGHWQRAACELLGLDRSTVYRGIQLAMRDGAVVKRGPRMYLAAVERSERDLTRLILARVSP